MAFDADWIRFTLSGIGAGLVAIGGSATVVFGAIGKVRRDSEEGDKALWKALNNADHDTADHRVENERHFATKGDLADLEDSVLKRLDQHEARASAAMSSGLQQIQTMISSRGPVK